MNTTTIAGTAGRLAGHAARGLIWAYREIDWAEVADVVLHGIKVLIVLTLLAGRLTRRAWDALPVLSERLGRWYSALLVPSAPAAAPEPVRPSISNLEQLSNRELRELLGIRRKLAKRQLLAMAQTGTLCATV